MFTIRRTILRSSLQSALKPRVFPAAFFSNFSTDSDSVILDSIENQLKSKFVNFNYQNIDAIQKVIPNLPDYV